MRFILFVITYFSLLVPCHAMDVAGYKVLKMNTYSGEIVKQTVAKATLGGFFQGQADIFELTRDGRKQFLYSKSSVLQACVPTDVRITGDLLLQLADMEITQHADKYNSNSKWESLPITTFVYMGLIRLFPCSTL